MVLSLSQKSSCVMQSEIRNMSIECDKVGGINLSQGVCNLEVPEPVRQAAKAAIDGGQNCYTRYDGIEELRQAVARKLINYGIPADPEREVVICSGSTGAAWGKAFTCMVFRGRPSLNRATL